MKKLFLNILVLLVILTASVTGYFVYRGYRRYRSAVDETPTDSAAEVYENCSYCLAYEEIDPDFVHAVVAVEDRRFFYREGFDWVALIRAVVNNLRAGRAVEGGSTIPQQIAKNLYFQGVPRGIDEKIAEVFIMSDLEEQYSHEYLFAVYANMNYYGDGYWGLANAAEGYYGTSASDLSIAQAAMLAGIPNAPGIYQLSTGHDLALNRQRKVLNDMKKNKFISEEEFELALAENV